MSDNAYDITNPSADAAEPGLPPGRAAALTGSGVGSSSAPHTNHDGEQFDREERAALQRIEGLSTELEDVTEVEYRQLRLERVVLAGVWTEGTAGNRAVRARTLAPDFTPLGDPIALSPPAGSFGQGVLGAAGNYVAAVFLLKGEGGFELWGAMLRCG